MTITRTFNEYKEIVYSFVTLCVVLLPVLGWVPAQLDKDVVKAVVVLLIIGPGVFLEFFAQRIIYQHSKTQAVLEELEHDLLTNRVKTAVVFRNAPFPDLANILERFTKAIQDKNWWDWSYIGSHPDCNSLCTELFHELHQVYMNSSGSDKILTSSVTFLSEYPLKRKSLIFMGDVIVPENASAPKDFPDNIWGAVLKGTHKLDFNKLYIIESAWRVGRGICTVRKGYIERDPSKILKTWQKVNESMRFELAKGDTLVYKDCPPKSEKKQSFFNKLKAKICETCESPSFFVVSPFTGNPSSFFRKGVIENFGAKILLFAGWLLSPLSFYNDAYVNVPISLIISYPFIHFWGMSMFWVFGLAYAFTNVSGFALIYLGLRIGKKKPYWRIPAVRTLITFVIFLTITITVGIMLYH